MSRCIWILSCAVLSCSSCLCITNTRAEPPQAPITAAVFRSGGEQVLVGSQSGVFLHSWHDLNCLAHYDCGLENIHDITYSPSQEKLAIVGGTPGEGGQIEIRSAHDFKQIKLLSVAEDLVYSACWIDEERIAIASADKTCAVIELGTERCVQRFEGHSESVLTLQTLSSNHVISAGVDRTIRLWNVKSGELIRTLDNHLSAINQIALQPNPQATDTRRLISVSEDQTVRLWNPNQGRLIRFVRISSVPQCVAWNPGDARLAVGCRDGKVYVIDAESLKIESVSDGQLGRVYQLQWHPDRRELLLAGEKGFRKHRL